MVLKSPLKIESVKTICESLRPLYKYCKKLVVWIGSNSHARFCEHDQLQWENTEFTDLGVKFTNSLKDMVDLNYRDKLNDIRKLFLNWSKRILAPLGKITTIKN